MTEEAQSTLTRLVLLAVHVEQCLENPKYSVETVKQTQKTKMQSIFLQFVFPIAIRVS
jgi:hypothetical protein